MQREDVLEHALTLLEQHGFATTTLDMLAEKLGVPVEELTPFWPDREALLYDGLRHHSQQVDTWRRQLLLDDEKSIEQKLLARYQVLHESVNKQRYPGCLFIAACSFFPDINHPIHQIAEQQKQASYRYTRDLLEELETDDPEMVAQQMELILEGCLSNLLVKHQAASIATAQRLAEDVLRFALCRKGGALT
ncbi:transcriptional regulator [Pectobacterium parmentieri]|uniref:Transcriptional regulator n=1 Tax=Pectobacterium parmentieri TaxID=1905730 RepID=A0A0H3HZA7_PECPM|nr:transcriptional regulator [Pectobacterium parmentieri]ACX86541.1 putative transcriptional regulator, TetR family [Pectobacterium parmentieri WPP163]AFI88744.1 HTH-type transcriptional regulator yjdC [Pectobacterium parmentieri]AOR60262.1 transcriptional regulator [Pectobacterium parmentieri]AYH00031.1 transcriptional regulator [Pectobacterium parmentieri]AYH04501.1 transcriptional regulator [Pectobacterium parmentieri]